MESVQVTRRKKIAMDNKAKKLKILHNRKYKYKVGSQIVWSKIYFLNLNIFKFFLFLFIFISAAYFWIILLKVEVPKYDDSTNVSVASGPPESETGDDKVVFLKYHSQSVYSALL